jgi:ribosomal protein L35AE/L33A
LAWLIVFVMAGCAKKMLPPSPDRFSPRLTAVTARVRTQVELTFDERLDAGRLSAESLLVVRPDGSAVALRGVSLGRSDAAVLVWAGFEPGVLYEIRGTVFDATGNPGWFRARFVASLKSDTIPPRLRRLDPPAGATGRMTGQPVRVRFTEALDTAAVPTWFFVPSSADSQYRFEWDPDWQGFRLQARESLVGGGGVYFVLLPGLRDLDGNVSSAWALTYFTSDSAFVGRQLRGSVGFPAGQPRRGMVLFDGPSTFAAALLDSSGGFLAWVPESAGTAVALADSDGDGLADLVSAAVPYSTDGDSLFLELRLQVPPRRFDAYRR